MPPDEYPSSDLDNLERAWQAVQEVLDKDNTNRKETNMPSLQEFGVIMEIGLDPDSDCKRPHEMNKEEKKVILEFFTHLFKIEKELALLTILLQTQGERIGVEALQTGPNFLENWFRILVPAKDSVHEIALKVGKYFPALGLDEEAIMKIKSKL